MCCSVIYKSHPTATFLPAWEQLNKQHGTHTMEIFAAIKILTSQVWELMLIILAPRSSGVGRGGGCGKCKDYKVSARPAWDTM